LSKVEGLLEDQTSFFGDKYRPAGNPLSGVFFHLIPPSSPPDRAGDSPPPPPYDFFSASPWLFMTFSPPCRRVFVSVILVPFLVRCPFVLHGAVYGLLSLLFSHSFRGPLFKPSVCCLRAGCFVWSSFTNSDRSFSSKLPPAAPN